MDWVVVYLLLPGRPERTLLGHHLLHHYAAHMALHALFYELDLHHELYDSVSRVAFSYYTVLSGIWTNLAYPCMHFIDC